MAYFGYDGHKLAYTIQGKGTPDHGADAGGGDPEAPAAIAGRRGIKTGG